MPDIRIPKYFSQLDGDSSPYSGTCAETCLKMMDHHLTGREIPIADIVINGDKDGSNTTLAGMRQAAQWLGFDLEYKDNVREEHIKKWLSEGRLILAVIKYSLWENKYKQDLAYPGGHAILITGITDDGKAIRFADPYFKDGKIKGIYDGKRWDGWMENNKWASYGDFWKASYHNDTGICINGTVMVCTKAKEPPKPPTPPTDPCADVKKQLATVTAERDSLKKTVTSLETQVKTLNADISKLKSDHQNVVTKMTAEHNLKTSEMKSVHDKKYNALEESKREMEDQHKVTVDRLVIEKDKLEEELSKVPQQLADKDVVIEAQRERIEQLIAQNTENISNLDLIRVVIKRLLTRK